MLVDQSTYIKRKFAILYSHDYDKLHYCKVVIVKFQNIILKISSIWNNKGVTFLLLGIECLYLHETNLTNQPDSGARIA